MKKGDIVIINDNSWTRSVVNGKLIHESLNYSAEIGKKYVIIETGCSFPLVDGCCGQPNTYRNDTVIQAVDSGKVVFIHGRFLDLVPPKHRVMIDVKSNNLGGFVGSIISGTIIEISDKLYQEIKRDSQN